MFEAVIGQFLQYTLEEQTVKFHRFLINHICYFYQFTLQASIKE